jgi:hypothetical protein
MIVLAASTTSTSSMRVWPVSRSIAPWMFRRSRPLLCRAATCTSLGAQQPTARHGVCRMHRCREQHRFISRKLVRQGVVCPDKSRLLCRIQLARYCLRCSTPSRCNNAISPDRPSYSMPHSRQIHAPISGVVRARVASIQAFSRSCYCSAVSRQAPPHSQSSSDLRSRLPDTADTKSGSCRRRATEPWPSLGNSSHRPAGQGRWLDEPGDPPTDPSRASSIRSFGDSLQDSRVESSESTRRLGAQDAAVAPRLPHDEPHSPAGRGGNAVSIALIGRCYDTILAEAVHEAQPTLLRAVGRGKAHGRQPRRADHNLPLRPSVRKTDVWRFLPNRDVPFSPVQQ